MVEEEDASAEAEEIRQERMGLTPDWLIDVRLHTAYSCHERMCLMNFQEVLQISWPDTMCTVLVLCLAIGESTSCDTCEA